MDRIAKLSDPKTERIPLETKEGCNRRVSNNGNSTRKQIEAARLWRSIYIKSNSLA